MPRPIKNKDGHEKILKAARKILIKQGLEQVTARNIAKASGYGLGSMYSYFDNINDLLLQINGQTLQELFDQLNQLDAELKPSQSKLTKLCHAYFDFAFNNKELWNSVINYSRDGSEKSAKTYQERVDNISRLVEHIITPHLKPGHKKTEMALLLWAALEGIWHLSQRPGAGFKTLPAQDAKKMVEILVKNLFA